MSYQPHDEAHRLDVEVVDAAELRRRVASVPDRGFERVDFLCVVFVRAGVYTHTVDFEVHYCGPGSCLVIGPGQVHRFGRPSDWDGSALVVGSHHAPPATAGLPTHVRAAGRSAAAIDELLERMKADTRLPADRARLGDLLALQVGVLVDRLSLAATNAEPAGTVDPVVHARYRAYRALVDERFARWHLVAPYARHLGCAPKSLTRACRAVGGVTAKQVVVDRIVLEAKRLLAHSPAPTSVIGAELGFDEPTNFTKFFRRETAMTPSAFRASLRS